MDLLCLQQYLRQALGAHAPLAALVAERIYDRVPGNGDFPYLTLDVSDGVDDSLDCLDQWLVTAQVHVWSRAVGSPEARRIAIACHQALAERWPSMPGFRVMWFRTLNQVWMRDPDGLTTHGVLQFESRYGPEE
jgi:hypothetical protein